MERKKSHLKYFSIARYLTIVMTSNLVIKYRRQQYRYDISVLEKYFKSEGFKIN